MTVNYLEVGEVIWLHELAIAQSGGGAGIRDQGNLDSCINQPRMTFGGQDLYPSLAEKAATLAYSLVRNHPFVDGNKRIGYVAAEAFLIRNGFELSADIDDAEATFLSLAAGEFSREELIKWLQQRLIPLRTP